MFRKFDKIYRIQLGDYRPKGKYHLAIKKVEELLDGLIYIFEKVDGGNSGIYKINNKCYLQKKGSIIDYSHPQYSFFQNEWYWNNKDKLDKLPNNIVVYGELMRCKHTIYYDKLPDWWLVFDIYDLLLKKYLSWEKVKQICDNAGLNTVPFIAKVKIKNIEELTSWIPKISKYGNTAEGIVVKNYDKQLMGKWVYPWFVKTVDESGFWRDKKIEFNKVLK